VEQIPVPLGTPTRKFPARASSITAGAAPTVQATSALFIATDQTAAFTPQASVVRSRFVKINRSLLLDHQGQALPLSPNSEVSLNLFPDTDYTGIIERIEEDGNGVSWVGHLKDVATSELFIVYSAGVFIGHFASPGGVYEVSSVGDELYQIIMIDQSKLQGPGGEEPSPASPTGTSG